MTLKSIPADRPIADARMSSDLYRVEEGLATLGDGATRIMNRLEARFLALASEFGAKQMVPPPLMRVADLDRIDYFENFPHLGSWVSPLKHECLDAYTKKDGVSEIPAHDLCDASYGLPSAACYNVYRYLRDSVIEDGTIMTLMGRCFRRETHYRQLERLWGFHMREIVCIGAEDAVKAFLRRGKALLQDIVDGCGLKIQIETAQDPFFSKTNPRAAMQKMFPTKEEFQCGDGALAIASVNFHHNFFGERFAMKTADGKPAFTGCVAMGLERWISVLIDRHGGDVDAILGSIDKT